MDVTMEKGPFMFLNEWQLLFSEEKVDDVKIQKYCINGCLNNSNIRSLAWRIILKILPLRRSEWTKALKKSREDYEAVKAKLNFDPRADKENIDDENINNPLCINTMNPWCIYFENSKLREIISKDVERTYPDLPFFQSLQIRELMVNILFTYSKCHPQISYRQGMHELLAPIIFVFNLDQRMYQQLKEQNCLSYSSQAGFSFEDIHLLQELNDSRFFEHDVYTMFCRLMQLVECFYLVRTDEEIANDLRSRAHSIATKHFKNHLARVPFSDPQHSDHDQSTIHRRLEVIHGELLMTIDPPLARHLNSLQVLPQVYGIRWLRLLFGREFSILELVTIWDVIFADQCSQSMINYIFVALLVQIRHSLLRSDYCTCVHLLMKYQSTQDVGVFIRFVLSLKYPQKFPIPDAMSDLALYVNPERTNARTEWIWAKNNLTPPFKEKMNRKHEDRVLDNVLNKIGRQALAAYPANFHRKERRQTPSESSSSEKNLQILNRRDLTRKASPISNHGSHSEGEIELMKEQISLLQSRLNDVDCIGQISAQKIRGCADEKRMETPEGRRHLIDELNEIAEHLTRSTVSEQYIRQHVQPPPAVPNGMKGDAVELASEVLGFRGASSTLEAAAGLPRSRLSSKTLPRSNNEMIELRFDKKKNY